MDTPTQDLVAALFVDFSVRKLQTTRNDMRSCVQQLSDQQIWYRDAPHENTVGNLILHLCGNIRQWILHGIDKQPDVRVRDAEFEADSGLSGVELLALFTKTTEEACTVIQSLSAERLLERTNPQPPRSGELSVLDAVYQVVGHVQLHVGQIILLTKQIMGTDLDLSLPRRR